MTVSGAADPSTDDPSSADTGLIDRLVACQAVAFGDFTLTSGAKSAYYVDIKRATTDPDVLRTIARPLAQVTSDVDLVAGMALGAVPIAVATSLEAGRPFVMVRKGERGHGTGKRIEGPEVKGKVVLVVEDVATSGGSIVEAVETLRDAGAMVHDAWVVVDRGAGAAELLDGMDVRLHALVHARDLLARSDPANTRPPIAEG